MEGGSPSSWVRPSGPVQLPAEPGVCRFVFLRNRVTGNPNPGSRGRCRFREPTLQRPFPHPKTHSLAPGPCPCFTQGLVIIVRAQCFLKPSTSERRRDPDVLRRNRRAPNEVQSLPGPPAAALGLDKDPAISARGHCVCPTPVRPRGALRGPEFTYGFLPTSLPS